MCYSGGRLETILKYVESRFLRLSSTEQSSLFPSYLMMEEVHPKSILSDDWAMHELQKMCRTIKITQLVLELKFKNRFLAFFSGLEFKSRTSRMILIKFCRCVRLTMLEDRSVQNFNGLNSYRVIQNLKLPLK